MSDAEVAYWTARALFAERKLMALGEAVDFVPTPDTPAAPKWWPNRETQLDIAEMEGS
jgi:hypothetical protein